MDIRRKLPLKKEIKFRLIKHLNFLENEFKDYETFITLTWEEFNKKNSKRRDVERWIENIINSSIDIAKLIIIAEGLPLADTYKDMITTLLRVPGFEQCNIEKISKWVRLRNIITHEYLDIRWASISRFLSEAKPLYDDLLKQVKKYLEENTYN